MLIVGDSEENDSIKGLGHLTKKRSDHPFALSVGTACVQCYEGKLTRAPIELHFLCQPEGTAVGTFLLFVSPDSTLITCIPTKCLGTSRTGWMLT